MKIDPLNLDESSTYNMRVLAAKVNEVILVVNTGTSQESNNESDSETQTERKE